MDAYSEPTLQLRGGRYSCRLIYPGDLSVTGLLDNIVPSNRLFLEPYTFEKCIDNIKNIIVRTNEKYHTNKNCCDSQRYCGTLANTEKHYLSLEVI